MILVNLSIKNIFKYPKNDKIKIIWNDVMCSYDQLTTTLFFRLLSRAKGSTLIPIIKLLKYSPFNKNKYSLKYIVRVELIGSTILGESVRSSDSKDFRIHFNYEVPLHLLSKEKTSNLFKDFILFSRSKLEKEMEESNRIEIFRFTEIVTEVSFKMIKK